MNSKIKERIIELVKAETNIDLSLIDHNLDIRDQIFIDSLQLVRLFAIIVDDLNIELPMEILSSNTFNQLVAAIVKEIENQAA